MNPWDIRAALLARHAQHVVLIHFPIALGLTGVLFDLLRAWTRRKEFALVAYYNFTVAALSAVPVLLTGILAWRLELEGRRLKGILLMHLLAGSTSMVLLAAVWLSHRRRRRHPDAPVPAYHWPLETLGVVVITLAGYLGGILSGVNHP